MFKISKTNMLISPLKKRAMPNHIDMLRLLNHCGWKQLIFRNVGICKMFCAVLQSTLCKSFDFWVLIKALFTLAYTLIYACTQYLYNREVFLNCRAMARYRALASIIPDRERPEETTLCYKISLVQLITNLNVILYLSTCHTTYISVLILFI